MRDLFAYRGWPWWFGTAWLVLCLIALTLKARFLIIPAFLLFGIAIVGCAIEGLRTGRVEAQFGAHSRFRSPISFWLYVLFYLAFGSMFVVASLVGLLRAIAR